MKRFLAGTSRGHVLLFSVPCRSHASSSSHVPVFPTRLWHPHTKPVTHISSAYIQSESAPNTHESLEHTLLILSASEDSHVAMVIAVSHASGSLYMVRFALVEAPAYSSVIGMDIASPGGRLLYRIDVLEQTLLATSPHAITKCSLNSTAKHVQSHVGSVGLKLISSTQVNPPATSTHTTQPLSDFRLATCELDGTLGVWSLRPPRLIRSFRLGYLRVVNPWTAKYERSVQLLPPSTTLFQNSSSVSSTLLCAVLRKWSRELVPIGVAGPRHGSVEPPCFTPPEGCIPAALDNSQFELTSIHRSPLSSGSVMVSLADSGRTLVIVPLTTLQPD
ncbi:unnamed protein product [Echinostoma caproni]|uniref:WD_REPEATS_REGION domain-containing protein n=1 Tax=Echinostoma caproni TaxID=27848 RepID=A0A183AU21_9TREM|nr:unnamed protein product [Echinostoma caproni]